MRLVGLIAGLTLALLLSLPAPSRAQSVLSPAFAATDAGLSPEARAGREIWMFATAFNDRFFTYTYPQRLGGAIDWYGILRADRRQDLFEAWGAIPDPDCCVPGDPDCPARSSTETYGFLWCPGDDALLSFVGREGYRDPACDFADAPFDTSTPHGSLDQRQSACDLRFGTSTGALGLRKFPNPRFDAAAWDRIGGWAGYAAFLSNDPASPDSRLNRLWDGSIEPPFRIGMACGACHIAYDPLKPPADAKAPAWDSIQALVGNQYSRISNLLGSGLSPHRLEWQLIARARPGIVDTSALPMDFVSNPGTMNAIINFAKRPTHRDDVLKWRKASACAADAAPEACWCEPARQGKCWERSVKTETVPSVLKGGEDFDRLQRGDPAGLLQHRLLRRAMLDQPSDRPARRRPRAAQLRPDPVRHRPVPARLRLVPRNRGPARRHPRLLPDRPPDRPLERPRPRLAAGPGGRPRRRVFRRRGRAGPAGLRRQLRPLPFEPARSLRSHRLPRDRPGRSNVTDRLARQRPDLAGLRDRHLSGAVAALQPHAEPGLGRVRFDRRAEPPGRPPAARGAARRRARLLPQHLALERLGTRALHAEQRHRPRDSAASRRPPGWTSTPRPMSTPPASSSPIRPAASPSIPVSKAATRSTRPRCRICSTPTPGRPRCSCSAATSSSTSRRG